MSRQVATLIVKSAPSEQVSLIESLAQAQWPHPELIATLCTLPPSRCAPLLRHSPVLDQGWLWQIAQTGEEGHALSICARPDLGPDLITALIRLDNPALWLALLNNPQIEWRPEHMDHLIQKAQTHLGLRNALTRHPALTIPQLEQLLSFVGPRLKAELLKRIVPSDTVVISAAPLFTAAKGSWLNRLSHKDLEGCLTAIGHELLLPVPTLEAALNSGASLALMLTALKVDQAAFPALMDRLIALNNGHPALSTAQKRLLLPILSLPADQARARLMALHMAAA
ncbi:MAG: DUF2336 domain-containing protein [Asticcacaulis sp.]